MALPVRVAVVNDYTLVVAGVARVLESFSDRVEVVELDSRRPVVSEVDVVLYDTFGQDQGSLVDPDALAHDPSARVVVFSWNTDAEQVRASLGRGAAGVVSKGSTAEEIVDAILRVHRGEQVVPSEAETSCETGDTFGRWPGDALGLSARESEVLALICQGLSNVQITQRAYIGINTVKTYIRSLYRKIEVTTRSQAVVWGMTHGFQPDYDRVVTGGRPRGGSSVVS